MELRFRHKILGRALWVLLGRVDLPCISGSLNCGLRCVGICQAMTSGVDLHFEVVLPWSVWHSFCKTLRLGYTRCTWGISYSYALAINGLNLGPRSWVSEYPRNVWAFNFCGCVFLLFLRMCNFLFIVYYRFM